MTLISVVFPLLFMIVGALMMALGTHKAVFEMGRGLFWAGAFALAFRLDAHAVHF